MEESSEPGLPPGVVEVRQLAGSLGSSWEVGLMRTREKPSPSGASGQGDLSLYEKLSTVKPWVSMRVMVSPLLSREPE